MFTVLYYVSKLIRIKDSTFEELIKDARWNDTIDGVIKRLIHQRKEPEAKMERQEEIVQ
jgi:predicted CopG family antitoxin